MFQITKGKAKKYVVSLHGLDVMVSPYKSRSYRKTIAQMAKHNNVIFTSPSEFLKAHAHKLLSIPRNKIKVIGNILDERFYEESIDNYRVKINSKYNICTVGRLVECKGHDT